MLVLCLIILIVLFHFSLSIKNEFSLDDYLYLDTVKNIYEWSDLFNVFHTPFSLTDYRPVTSLTFAIEQLIFGGQINPHFSHAVNLFIYILGIFFFYKFLKKCIKNLNEIPIAWISIILFASLPLHNSMVSNIKSRDGLLSFMFGMIYLYAICQVFDIKNTTIKRFIYLVVTLLSITLGIYSKIDALNFLLITPFVYLIIQTKFQVKTIIKTVIFCILFILLGSHLFRLWNSKKIEVLENTGIESIGDAVLFSENPIIDHPSIIEKFSYTIQTYWEYIKMVFSPSGHYFYYGFNMVPILECYHPIVIFSAILLLILIVLSIVLFKKSKIASWGILFFLISILYCSNLVTPVSGIIADRYIFIASAGACTFLGFCIWKITLLSTQTLDVNIIDSNKKQFIVFTIPTLLFTTLFYLPNNIKRVGDWKNLESIFEADLPHISHKSYNANLIAMKNYMSIGKISQTPINKYYYNKVIQYGNEAIKIYPEGQYAYDLLILAYYQNEMPYKALQLARESILKFDTTEAGWRIMTDYYYYQSNWDSLNISCQKLLKLSPLDPYVNMMYVEVLDKLYSKDIASRYIDSIKILYPDSELPSQMQKILIANNEPQR